MRTEVHSTIDKRMGQRHLMATAMQGQARNC